MNNKKRFHSFHVNKGCGHTEQTVFSPYPFADDITKAALSLQLFDDHHECRSGRGLNPRRPARQTVVKLTELIKRRLATRVILNHIILIWTALGYLFIDGLTSPPMKTLSNRVTYLTNVTYLLLFTKFVFPGVNLLLLFIHQCRQLHELFSLFFQLSVLL